MTCLVDVSSQFSLPSDTVYFEIDQAISWVYIPAGSTECTIETDDMQDIDFALYGISPESIFFVMSWAIGYVILMWSLGYAIGVAKTAINKV